jgi:hypothetical protein
MLAHVRLQTSPDVADPYGMHHARYPPVLALVAPNGVQHGQATTEKSEGLADRQGKSLTRRAAVAGAGRRRPGAGFGVCLVAAALNAGCQDWSGRVSRAGIPNCPPPQTIPDYFGTTVGRNLRALKAVLDGSGSPSLSCSGPRPEAYRLIFNPSSRSSFVVTVTERDGIWEAEAVELSLVTYTRQYTVLRRQPRRSLPESEIGVLKGGLDRALYWTVEPIDNRVFDDGNTIAIEARTDAGYRVVLRRSPPDGPFVRTAFLFFELAGLPYPEGEPLPWEGEPSPWGWLR